MTLYQQLADDIRLAITGGVYGTGERLPSIRNISDIKQMSISTVQKAYCILEQEGWISASARSGYFVRKPAAPAAGQQPPQPWSGEFEDLMPSLLQQTRQPGMLNLGLAQPEQGLIPHKIIAKTMRGIMREQGSQVLGYSDPAGLWELRKQIVLLLSAAGLQADIDDVVVTNGCQEALFVAFQTVTNPGDIVAVESPCYCGALQILSSLDVRILEIPSTPEHGIRLDLLAEAAKQFRIAACYVMPAVSNPAGGSMTRQDKEGLCDLAGREGFTIIEDSTNGDLTHSDGGRRPLKAYDTSSRVILCSSFSKTLAPGLRIGWLIADRNRFSTLTRKYGTSLNTSTLNQLTVAQLLSAGHYRRHVARTRPIHAQSLRVLRKTVQDSFPAGCEISSPTGGFCLWVQLPASHDSTALSRDCAESGVVFAPGRIFAVGRDLQNYLRIGWGGEWDSNIGQGIRVIASQLSRAS